MLIGENEMLIFYPKHQSWPSVLYNTLQRNMLAEVLVLLLRNVDLSSSWDDCVYELKMMWKFLILELDLSQIQHEDGKSVGKENHFWMILVAIISIKQI